MDVLAQTQSGVEANLVLNTLVLLRDGAPGYDFKLTADSINAPARNNSELKRRLEYLGVTGPQQPSAPKTRGKKKQRPKAVDEPHDG